jgi:transcriptional regulator with AAA-type ATPase domain
MLRGIARHLHDAAADVLDLLHGTEVMARLVQGDSDPDEMIAVSARMRSVVKKIDSCAGKNTPVLVLGENGTGKALISRLIHDGSSRASSPVIAVNCAELAPEHAAELILGKDLGGRLPSDSHGSGGIHLAHGGTLVLRSADTLDPVVQKLIASQLFAAKARSEGSYPDTRIIVTARTSEATDGGDRGLDGSLVNCFEDVIKLPALADRPKDIRPLAEGFLKRHGPNAPVLSDEARNALVSLPYRRRNVAELREVIDLAVRVADGPEIRAEHIFSGVEEEAIPGLDLTRTPMFQRFLKPNPIRLARWVTLVSFVAVIVLCLTVTTTWLAAGSNTFIWAVWEPVVFGMFLLAGPLWCTVCPLSTAARMTKKMGSRDRNPSKWVIRHGPWLAIVGFALIIWFERVFKSTENPVASAILLASLIGSAVFFAVLYKREVWCRHLCPLGRLATALAPAAPLQLTAKRQVCASSCTTHDCYKGAGNIPGCTVFHHPLEGRQAYRCKLCMDCLQSCPHGSARLQIRSPLIAIWNADTNAKDLAMFSIAVSLLALVFAANHAFPLFANPVVLTAACIAAVVIGVGLHHLILRIAGTDERRNTAIRVSLALMILGWAALMTGQLANIPVISEAHVAFASEMWLPSWFPDEVSMLTMLQVLLVLFAVFLALFTLDQVPRRRSSVAARVGWLTAPAIFLVYAATVIFLVTV